MIFLFKEVIFKLIFSGSHNATAVCQVSFFIILEAIIERFFVKIAIFLRFFFFTLRKVNVINLIYYMRFVIVNLFFSMFFNTMVFEFFFACFSIKKAALYFLIVDYYGG